jgi:hypothetical protein
MNNKSKDELVEHNKTSLIKTINIVVFIGIIFLTVYVFIPKPLSEQPTESTLALSPTAPEDGAAINPNDTVTATESSSIVPTNTTRVKLTETQPSPTSCPNALSSRIEIGKYAYVATDPPLNNRVRENAGRSYAVIGHILTGNAMKILDGPKCADNWAWWKVQSINEPSLVGWTSEGDDVYWLIPCDSLDSCP